MSKIKAAEARKIIGNILQWQFVLMGVKEPTEIELDKSIKLEDYSLEDLIHANKKIKQGNNKARKMQAFWSDKSKAHSKGITQRMTLDDRLISAIYTILHFPTGSEMVAIVNNKGVGVVPVNYGE